MDLRLATKKGTDNFYFTHGLYAEEISGALNQVKSFVESHPGEVIKCILYIHLFDKKKNKQHFVHLIPLYFCDITYNRNKQIHFGFPGCDIGLPTLLWVSTR